MSATEMFDNLGDNKYSRYDFIKNWLSCGSCLPFPVTGAG